MVHIYLEYLLPINFCRTFVPNDLCKFLISKGVFDLDLEYARISHTCISHIGNILS